MATELVEAPVLDEQLDFERDAAPQNTARVKWNVKGGKDRNEEPQIGINYTLKGQPNIQGITIWTSNVILYAWTDLTPNGEPRITRIGPTAGQSKVDPAVRLGSYRVEYI